MGQKITKGKAKFRRSPQLSSKRKKLFLLITFLLPFVILALLETGLRIFDYGGNASLFVSTPNETSKFYGINLNVAKRYFTKLSDVPTPRKDLFLKVKPANGYRIFVLGGSTTAGFPYGNNVTFTRILNRRLSDTFPDKYIEVVNTAMTAINTYTQLDFMDEILKYQPDAILIYSGHNEYYGALGVGSMESFGKSRWMVKATLSLQKFKIYLLMRDFVTWIKSLFGNSETDENLDPSATMMERIVKEDIIPLNSEDYETGKNQFKENIKEIIEKAKDAGVKVILSELISNVRDNKPFESVESKAYPSANKEFELAEEYEKEGKYDEARKAYYFAKDLDPLRFRAPEDFNKIIHDLGREYNVPVVPMESYFESASPHELIGNGLIFEHLHPNIKGYFLMAQAVAKEMQNVMEADMSAYVWWYIVRYYGPIGDGEMGTRKGEVTKRGYIMSQFSKFIRPGYHRVEGSVYPSLSYITVTAYKDSSSSKIIIVAVNPGTTQTLCGFRIPNLTSGTSFTTYTTSATQNVEQGNNVTVTDGSFNFNLEPSSITTFVSQ